MQINNFWQISLSLLITVLKRATINKNLNWHEWYPGFQKKSGQICLTLNMAILTSTADVSTCILQEEQYVQV